MASPSFTPPAGGKTKNFASVTLGSNQAIASTGTQSIVTSGPLVNGTYLVLATILIGGATTAGVLDVQLVIPGVGAIEATTETIPLAASGPTTTTIYAIATINSANNTVALQVNCGASGGPVGSSALKSSAVGSFGPTTMMTTIQIA